MNSVRVAAYSVEVSQKFKKAESRKQMCFNTDQRRLQYEDWSPVQTRQKQVYNKHDLNHEYSGHWLNLPHEVADNMRLK